MRNVAELGGPGPSYLSELETGKRSSVSRSCFVRWLEALRVTEDFALGRIARYHEHPEKCCGLASEVAATIREDWAENTAWRALDPLTRAQKVLHLIATESKKLPEVVLAYVLGIERKVLEEQIRGELLITAEELRAISDIAGLPDCFIKYGIFEETTNPGEIGLYLRTLELAKTKGISPEQLAQIILTWDYYMALRAVRERGASDPSLNDLLSFGGALLKA